MHDEAYTPTRFEHALNELVVAEMLLLQATMESAGAIGGALLALTGDGPKRPVADVLWDTADQAYDAYASRIRLLRRMRTSDRE